MQKALEDIKQHQRDTWNKFSGGWKKWNDFTMDFLRNTGTEIIQSLKIKETDIVLDVASGTGEPAFTIAGIAKKGRVYATDLSEQMIGIARESAAEKKISNIEFAVADVSELPFENNFFDKVSCRMGFMFFPDMQMAANEMFRVCKEGGSISTSVWAGPEINNWVTTIMNILAKNIETAPPPPGAPGMFRCAKPGLIKELFGNAGFKNVKETAIPGKVDYGDTDTYWQMMLEVAAPVVGALSKADDSTRKKIKEELFEECNKKLTDGRLVLDYASIVISGQK